MINGPFTFGPDGAEDAHEEPTFARSRAHDGCLSFLFVGGCATGLLVTGNYGDS